MARKRTILQISTAHITENDDAILMAMCDGDAAGLHVMYTGAGFILWRNLSEDPTDSIPTDECEDLGLSASFRKVLEAARNARADFINIDSDELEEGHKRAPIFCNPHLDKHDW